MVGRGGWLRLPQEFLERAGIGTRAAASLEDGRIVVSRGRRRRRAGLRRRDAGSRAAASRRETVAVVRGVVKTHGQGPAAAQVFSGLDAEFARRPR